MPFDVQHLQLQGARLVTPVRYEDRRGYFAEIYKKTDLSELGIVAEFVQDNHSYSTRGVLRGLHFQRPPRGQAKLVWAAVGEIYDVAVDLRTDSPSFGKWVGVRLSEHNGHMLYIPEGFAHGFCVLSAEAHVTYKVTKEYSAAHDAGIRWDDPALGVDWPVESPILSAKDGTLPFLEEVRDRLGFPYEEGS